MFKGILVLAAVGACVFFAVNSSSSYESVLEDTLGVYEKMAHVLSKITDEKSAELAKPKLEAMKLEIEDLERTAKSLKPVAPDEQQALHDQFAPRLQKTMTRVFGEMMRIAEIPAANEQLAAAFPVMTIPSLTPSDPSATRRTKSSTRKAGISSTRRTTSRRVPS